ncbi:ATP-binding protein [Parvicella tangerina]|uniref:histidine kinase n=1 Tax=Parvicella tangerina TaxID=2829795 RepID=A0A916JNY7_9FLAO|nr:ATP-binding protein [Parvicella tangerina]CAG5084673.1 Adaptive-response sensory-kinase SasA [Parvicella tangerina]
MNNKEYLNVLNSLKEGFQILDKDLKYVFLNRAAEQHSRMPPDSLIGRKMTECYPGIEKTKLFELIQDTLNNKRHNELDNEFFYPSGEKGWFKLSIQYSNERIFIVSHDITELVNKNKELEQFSYITSHDLQEPINSIISFVRLLEKDKEKMSPMSLKSIEVIAKSANRMKDFVVSLLEFSKVGAEKEKAEVNIENLVNNLKVDLHSLIEQSQATVNYQGGPITLMAFESDLTKLFQNLIVNGIKYTKEGIRPVVTIDVEEMHEKYKFSVTDNGIGIAEEQHHKIFEVFRRLHARDEYSGTGIGLAHCKKVAELHSGEIWLTSEPGKGSTFYFTISKR